MLCEIEGVKAGSRAFLAARTAGQTSAFHGAQGSNDGQYHQQGAFGDGKGKGKGKGKDGKGKGKGKGDGVKPPCWQFTEHGTCKYGGDCRFSHDAKDTGRTPSGALTKAAKAAAQAKAKAKAKAKSHGGDHDQSGGARGANSGKGGKDKKKILCK